MLRSIVLGIIVGVTVSLADTAHGQGNPRRGQQIVTAKACSICHGVRGNQSNPIYPKLAGQVALYTVKQLRDYKSGARSHEVMTSMVKGLSRQDIYDIAAYYERQGRMRPTRAGSQPNNEQGQEIYQEGLPESGVPACATCHGWQGEGIPPAAAALAGQHAEYIASQLRRFRDGDRSNDQNGTMRRIAEPLSDEQIEAIAEYVATLR